MHTDGADVVFGSEQREKDSDQAEVAPVAARVHEEALLVCFLSFVV